jgi:glycosyltransferase involved in cell wall biosynthesis
MIKVLMVGAVPFLYAGISKVAGAFLGAKKPGIDINYIATSTKKSVIYKISLYVAGFCRVFFALLFKRPHIMHIHFSKGNSIYRKYFLEEMACLFNVPVVIQSHSFTPRIEARNGIFPEPEFYSRASFFTKKIISRFLNKADGIVVLSQRIRFCFQNITQNRNIWVLHNPVDCHKYVPGEIKGPGKRVLFMGDFSERKGIKTLIRAASDVISEISDVRFVLCGGTRKEIAETVTDWGIENHVEIKGFVSGKEKSDIFKKADLFVLPSFSEGVPVAVLEALSSGLPIITTPVGGIPDVFKDYQNGLFIEPGDHKALAENILFLLKNDDVRERIGENNRKKALAEFDTPVVVEELRRIYERVIKRADFL